MLATDNIFATWRHRAGGVSLLTTMPAAKMLSVANTSNQLPFCAVPLAAPSESFHCPRVAFAGALRAESIGYVVVQALSV